jgi:hypothetical protein
LSQISRGSTHHREAKKDQDAAAKRQAEEHELECQGRVRRGEVGFTLRKWRVDKEYNGNTY